MKEKDKELRRDIEFRAKEIDTRRVVYGFPRRTPLGNWLMYSSRDGDTTRVIPATISQYIGIDDKDGARVYEGDTVIITSPAIGAKFERKVDWHGFVEFKTADFDTLHLDDLSACGYEWSLKPLRQ